MKTTRPLSLIALVIVAMGVGCGSGRVQVFDPMGKPIQGASVAPVSLSINGAPALTDAAGEASVPLNIPQPTRWIEVSSPGFVRTQLEMPVEWPLKVTLHPTTQPGLGPVGQDAAKVAVRPLHPDATHALESPGSK